MRCKQQLFAKNKNDEYNNTQNMQDIILGRNPVIEALKAERPINKILIASDEKKGPIKQIINLAKEKRIVIKKVKINRLNQIAKGNNHQGVIAFTSPFDYVEVDDILAKAEEKNEKPFILIADGITDPHNLGALIRTAEAAGVHGLIIPKHHSASVNSTVTKASAGAVEYLFVARETNIVRCIENLKRTGVWVIGIDLEGETLFYDADLKQPIALVIGGEDRGIRKLVKEKCDFIVKIPMKGKISSLNASVAGAIVMYEVVRQRS